ncbi:MAG: hypothetical protein E7273_06770 [Pseudobutyrivibrio ruminis]|nr:hypothetical protein [Pseudobutyrivibrio ruminis]
MVVKFIEEQLNNFDKAMLIQLFLTQQEQLESIDNEMQFLLEQMADMNRQCFGRSSEKSDESNQLSFTSMVNAKYVNVMPLYRIEAVYNIVEINTSHQHTG